jgi:hypothetical protein
MSKMLHYFGSQVVFSWRFVYNILSFVPCSTFDALSTDTTPSIINIMPIALCWARNARCHARRHVLDARCSTSSSGCHGDRPEYSEKVVRGVEALAYFHLHLTSANVRSRCPSCECLVTCWRLATFFLFHHWWIDVIVLNSRNLYMEIEKLRLKGLIEINIIQYRKYLHFANVNCRNFVKTIILRKKTCF